MSNEIYAEVSSRGQTMRGMIHRPDDFSPEQNFPAVMLWHGFSGTRAETHRILVKTARALAQRGIVAARFDFIGSGESDGDFMDMTPETEIDDALNVLEWMQTQPGIDRARLGLIGLSLGGFVSCCVASRSPQIKALVSWAAPTNVGERIRARLTPEAQALLQNQGWVDLNGNRVGQGFFEAAAHANPLKELSEYSGRALVVHGTQDQSVPVSNAHEYSDALAHCGAKLHIIEGADHTFNSVVWEREVIATTLDWLAENL